MEKGKMKKNSMDKKENYNEKKKVEKNKEKKLAIKGNKQEN